MSAVEIGWLVVAGVLAGIVSVVASLASLVSYPALLAIGLPPLSANVTNTVALVFTSVGSAVGSRPELAGRRQTVGKLSWLTAGGGGLGAAILLLTPASAFERVVPVLVASASAMLLARRGADRLAGSPPRRLRPATSRSPGTSPRSPSSRWPSTPATSARPAACSCWPCSPPSSMGRLPARSRSRM